MNKTVNEVNFITGIKNLISKNIKVIIYFFFSIIIFIIGIQFYFFYKNKKNLELSIEYNNSRNFNSQTDFIQNMSKIIKNNSFYSLLASLELINNKIKNNNYDQSYDDYLRLLDNKNIDNLYKSLLAVHGSYNLLDKINNKYKPYFY